MKKWICAALCLSLTVGLAVVGERASADGVASEVTERAASSLANGEPEGAEKSAAALTALSPRETEKPKASLAPSALPSRSASPLPSASASVETSQVETALPSQTAIPTPLPVFTGNKVVNDEAVFVTTVNESDKTCTIVGYSGDIGVTTLYIPKQIKKMTVTAVAGGVFSKCPFLKNVVVMGSVEFQGEAFSVPGIELWGKSGGKTSVYAAAKGLAFHPLDGSDTISGKKATNLKRATITWGTVIGAASYNLYRRQGEGKYSLCKNASAATYTNEGLKPGVKYTYKVTPVFTAANGDVIEGFASKELAISMKPAKVKKVRATGIRGGIQVRWRRDKNVSGYQVFMKVHVKGFKTNFNHVKTVKGNKTTGYRCKMLVRGMKYSYRVRSFVKVKGKKIYSPYVTVTAKAK